MSELSTIYDLTILDHNRNPRNFREIENADKTVAGYNPLCGDHLKLYLVIENDCIKDISFRGSCCAVSKASASMMTLAVKGKTSDETKSLLNYFRRVMSGQTDKGTEEGQLDAPKAFSLIREFPSRQKCASLGWDALHEALNDRLDHGEDDDPENYCLLAEERFPD